MTRFLLVLILFSFQAQAQSQDEARLIEYADEQGQPKIEWMTETQILELSQKQHELGRCPGYMDITENPEPPISPEFASIEALLSSNFLANRQPRFHSLVEPLVNEVRASNLENTVEHLSSYQNRYYQSQTGVDAAHWIRDQFQTMGQTRSDFSVRLFNHRFRQPSVIAEIRGNGPLASEVVLIGAHLDSIRLWSTSPQMEAPGADDDASGVATVLEIFRVILESGHQPQRTLQFMAYAGEEKGLLGSQDIANEYRRQGINVVAAMQFDMTMHPGTANSISLINDYTNPELTDFSKILIDTYVRVPWGLTACGYACSDHASWHRAGFASAFPFESPFNQLNNRIHTPDDLLEHLDTTWGSHYAKLGLAMMLELSAD